MTPRYLYITRDNTRVLILFISTSTAFLLRCNHFVMNDFYLENIRVIVDVRYDAFKEQVLIFAYKYFRQTIVFN